MKREANLDNFSIASIARLEIAGMWTRTKIVELYGPTNIDDRPCIPAARKDTALSEWPSAPFTTFVAVDSFAHTAGDRETSIAVPLPVPAGVRYDTTVSDTTRLSASGEPWMFPNGSPRWVRCAITRTHRFAKRKFRAPSCTVTSIC